MKTLIKIVDKIKLKDGATKITNLWKDGHNAYHTSYIILKRKVSEPLTSFKTKMYFPVEEITLDFEYRSQ